MGYLGRAEVRVKEARRAVAAVKSMLDGGGLVIWLGTVS